VPVVPTAAPLSARQLLAIPFLQSLIISAFALAFIATAFDTVFVLFAYTPIEVGGLGFSVRTGSRKFPDVYLTQP